MDTGTATTECPSPPPHSEPSSLALSYVTRSEGPGLTQPQGLPPATCSLDGGGGDYC